MSVDDIPLDPASQAYADAVRLLGTAAGIRERAGGGGSPADLVAHAHVHATLALAEEQRTANMLALVDLVAAVDEGAGRAVAATCLRRVGIATVADIVQRGRAS